MTDGLIRVATTKNPLQGGARFHYVIEAWATAGTEAETDLDDLCAAMKADAGIGEKAISLPGVGAMKTGPGTPATEPETDKSREGGDAGAGVEQAEKDALIGGES